MKHKRLTCDLQTVFGAQNCAGLTTIGGAIFTRHIHDDEALVLSEKVLLVVDGEVVAAAVPVDRASSRAGGVTVEVDSVSL